MANLYQVSLDELVVVKDSKDNKEEPMHSSTSKLDKTAIRRNLDKGKYETTTLILGIVGIKLVKKDKDDQRTYSKPGYVLSMVALFTGVMTLILAIFLIIILK